MRDPLGAILSWSLITAAAAYIVYHVVKVVRSRRLATNSAAAIMFGQGLLLFELPKYLYPDLPRDAFEAISWLAIVMVLSAIGLEIWDRHI